MTNNVGDVDYFLTDGEICFCSKDEKPFTTPHNFTTTDFRDLIQTFPDQAFSLESVTNDDNIKIEECECHFNNKCN